jgi:hypothetical protein
LALATCFNADFSRFSRFKNADFTDKVIFIQVSEYQLMSALGFFNTNTDRPVYDKNTVGLRYRQAG